MKPVNQPEEETHKQFMQRALELAEQAAQEDEVPVGALIVRDKKIIAEAYNKKEQTGLVTSHAEIMVLEEACKTLGTWRLTDCTLYVTLEPCLMCAGTIYQSRLKKVVYGCMDPKGGALGSLYSVHEDKRLNHNFSIVKGILEKESSELLKLFFKRKRGIKAQG